METVEVLIMKTSGGLGTISSLRRQLETCRFKRLQFLIFQLKSKFHVLKSLGLQPVFQNVFPLLSSLVTISNFHEIPCPCFPPPDVIVVKVHGHRRKNNEWKVSEMVHLQEPCKITCVGKAVFTIKSSKMLSTSISASLAKWLVCTMV